MNSFSWNTNPTIILLLSVLKRLKENGVEVGNFKLNARSGKFTLEIEFFWVVMTQEQGLWIPVSNQAKCTHKFKMLNLQKLAKLVVVPNYTSPSKHNVATLVWTRSSALSWNRNVRKRWLESEIEGWKPNWNTQTQAMTCNEFFWMG